jgi:uncharacterized Tic20 family protein
MDSPPSPPVSPPPRGNEIIWSILSHLSALVSLVGIGLILPLIVYLAMKGDSEFVANNAKEALNFHLSVFLYSLCCIPLIFVLIGIPLLIAIGLASLILAIVAAIKASDGGCYRYPLTLRFIS